MKHGHRFDGIVGRITKEIRTAAGAAGIPVVNTWGNSPVAAEVPCVQADFQKAGYMAVDHLYRRGLRRFVSFGFRGWAGQREYGKGFALAAREHGCPHECHFVGTVPERSSDSWDRFITTVKAAASTWRPPVGIVVFMDDLARMLMEELRDLGWGIPEEMAIVSVGNDAQFCDPYPSLSSVDQGYQVCGYEAAKLLARLLDGESSPQDAIRTPPKELVMRQSSDVFAVTNVQVARALRYMIEHSHKTILPRTPASRGNR